VHPFLITPMPGRFRRTVSAIRVWTVRLLALAVMTVLGVAVLTVRCARPLINYTAICAIHLELWAALRLGRPPVSSFVGAGLTDQFVAEFHRARTAAAGSPR
jgi:hypothetical protein